VIDELVPDGLWERVAPLLPPPKPRRHRYPGRRPIDDRAALAGMVFVLKTGITWNQVSTSLVGCSGVTCWRRLRDWTETAVWPQLHELLLAEQRATGQLDWIAARSTAPTSARLRGTMPALTGRPRPSWLQTPSDHRRRRVPLARARAKSALRGLTSGYGGRRPGSSFLEAPLCPSPAW
jgi:transposase